MSLRSHTVRGQLRLCLFGKRMAHTGSASITDASMMLQLKIPTLFLGWMIPLTGFLEPECLALLI